MASFTSFLLFVLVNEKLTQSVSSFILDGQKCLAFPPCTCFGSNVECYLKGLTTFPKFEVSNVSATKLVFNIYRNQLTTVPANSFRNITVSNNTKIYMYLYQNRLNTVERTAFLGIENRIVHLDLKNNNLTFLPAALGKLSNLENINLQSNPISSLDSNTMRGLGHSLKQLYIDMNQFDSWLAEFRFLTSLQTLSVRYLKVTHLGFDSFNGFENTLQTLEINYSLLDRVPVAICHLHNLQTFQFSHNKNLRVNSTIFEPCTGNLTSVTSVELSDDGLRYMPSVFNFFPSMTTLHANGNNLSFINSDIVPSNAPLTYLDLHSNYFTRIPSAISKFHSLVRLDMQYNKIMSVEDTDLSNFSQLQTLYLYHNPIEYISPNAFKNNLALYALYLYSTNLRHLPSSLAGLHDLRNLYLDGAPIQCDCDLSYLKPLNFTIITITGNCESSTLAIKKYLSDDLPNCL